MAAGVVGRFLTDVETYESVFFHQVIAHVLERDRTAAIRSKVAESARNRFVRADSDDDLFCSGLHLCSCLNRVEGDVDQANPPTVQ